MYDSQRDALWSPKLGIRFSPIPESRPLYPPLDLARFLHVARTSSQTHGSSSRLLDVEDDAVGSAEKADDALKESLPDVSEEEQAEKPEEPEKPDKPEKDDEAAKKKKELEAIPLPWTPLDFNISKELFRAAQASPAGSPDSFWSHTMYRGTDTDGSERRVTVHYCTTKQTTEYVCQKYFLGEEVLGFDLEWQASATSKDGPRKNVSLIQLASPSRIGLFHVALFKKDNDFVAPTFAKIMADDSISKVGVSIKADCSRLKSHLGVESRGIFELSHLYKLVKHSKDGRLELINRTLVSLATQSQEVLRLPLYKDVSVRTSDWMKYLDSRQLKCKSRKDLPMISDLLTDVLLLRFRCRCICWPPALLPPRGEPQGFTSVPSPSLPRRTRSFHSRGRAIARHHRIRGWHHRG